MVIKLPKGPSNSANLGATPGTQQSAINNAGGANFNPMMPRGPQEAKRARSGMQQGVDRRGGMQAPSRPVQQPRPQPQQPIQPPASRVVGQGEALGHGRGYNIFSGMDANQISGMNQTMGLSNMTALPSLAAAGKDPAEMPRDFGRQFSTQLMLGDAPKEGAGDSPMPGEETAGGYPKEEMTEEEKMIADVIAVQEKALEEQKKLGWTTQDYLDNATYAEGEGTDPENYGLGDPPAKQPNETEEEYLARLNEYWSAYHTKKNQEEKYQMEKGTEDAYASSADVDWSEPEEVIQWAIDNNSSEHPGMDPGKKEEIFAQIDSQGARKLEMALDRADQMAIMMGTHGSGAHMTTMNSAVAQVLTELAGQYADINKLDAEMYETDLQESIVNAISLAGADRMDEQMKIEIADLALESMVEPMGVWINEDGRFDADTADYLNSQLSYYAGLFWNDFWEPGKSIAVAMQQLSEYLKEFFSGISWELGADGEKVYSFQTDPNSTSGQPLSGAGNPQTIPEGYSIADADYDDD